MTRPAPLIECLDRQRTRRVDRRLLVRLATAVLGHMDRTAEVGIHLVGPREMEAVNVRFLGHTGSTDIITFDHGSGAGRLHGEMFICIADAVAQAEEFGTTWTAELARYVVHGLLHLDGYDDLEPAARRVMKRRENTLVRWLARNHPLDGLDRGAAGRRA